MKAKIFFCQLFVFSISFYPIALLAQKDDAASNAPIDCQLIEDEDALKYFEKSKDRKKYQ